MNFDQSGVPRLLSYVGPGRSHLRLNRVEDLESNIREQVHGVCLRQVRCSHGAAAGVRNAELNQLVGVRDPRLLIEREPAGFEMNGIIQLLRWGLVGLRSPLYVALQVY